MLAESIRWGLLVRIRSKQKSPRVGGVSKVERQKQVSMSCRLILLKSPPITMELEGKLVRIFLRDSKR